MTDELNTLRAENERFREALAEQLGLRLVDIKELSALRAEVERAKGVVWSGTEEIIALRAEVERYSQMAFASGAKCEALSARVAELEEIVSNLKNVLRRSVLLHDLGVAILTGEEAVERFDADRQAERMRAQTDVAVARLNELLIWLKCEHDKPEGDDAA